MREKPFISIVIPTFDRPERLSNCLESLVCVDYPPYRFEVIVVDDGGKYPLNSVVIPFGDRLAITLLRQSHAGPAAARNAGATRAKGDYLLFTDDDCKLSPNILLKLADCLAITPDAAIGGKTVNSVHNNLYSNASQLLIDYLYNYYNVNPNGKHFVTSNNIALPAKSFREINGFDKTFPFAGAEDREFCDRWQHHGHKIAYDPEVIMYHSHEMTLKSFLRQHFNYGRGAFHYHRIRARRTHRRIQMEPLWFYLNLVSFPFSQAKGGKAFLLSALLVLTQTANAAGFFWEWANKRNKQPKNINNS
jgi:glycosyltransferase involved in cell wall biosynthesis